MQTLGLQNWPNLNRRNARSATEKHIRNAIVHVFRELLRTPYIPRCCRLNPRQHIYRCQDSVLLIIMVTPAMVHTMMMTCMTGAA